MTQQKTLGEKKLRSKNVENLIYFFVRIIFEIHFGPVLYSFHCMTISLISSSLNCTHKKTSLHTVKWIIIYNRHSLAIVAFYNLFFFLRARTARMDTPTSGIEKCERQQ